jgi:hypothetical protein
MDGKIIQEPAQVQKGLMGSIIGNVSDIYYTYTDNYIRAYVYGVQSSTRYILTAFG